MFVAPAASAAKIPVKARVLRLGKVVLRCAILLYVLLVALMFFLQSYLIFPGTLRRGSPETVVQPDARSELVHLKAADGTALVGLFGKAAEPAGAEAPHPAILFFYGNGDCMNSALGEFNLFRGLGFPCMLVDYEGFGMSEGKASEQGCYAAAEAAYQYLRSRPEVDKQRLISAGWSLGGAVAIDLAWRHRNDGTFCALMTFSAFTSMHDMARLNYPFLPVSLMLQHHFKSEEKIREITIPYFLGHGQSDRAIPFAHADRLAAAYGGRPNNLTRFACAPAGHNDFFDTSGEPLQQALAAFLNQFSRHDQ